VRVLVVRPPEVPSYFNAGHHLPVFLVSAYLRSQGAKDVDALDAAALNVTWKELGDRLSARSYDVVACLNDFGEVGVLRKFTSRVRALCPSARIVTFGRLSAAVPRLFERHDVDAIVTSGDYEVGVLAYLRWLEDSSQPRPGLAVRAGERWLSPEGSGRLLPAAEWALPNVDEIPYEAYDRLYAREQSRFCGLPGRRELVVPVARGCPIACGFCEVWQREGRRERRLPVRRVVDYVVDSFRRAPFDYASMYAPTFTLRRRWVLELCDLLDACDRQFTWKCTTTVDHLDEVLVARMGTSGCTRISVGIETMEPEAQALLPPAKHVGGPALDALAGWCRAAGIELNCFVILGLPGATAAGSRATAEHLRSVGARFRPAMYAAYGEMKAGMDERRLDSYDRQLAPAHLSSDEAAAVYRLFHAE
jgi:anaerobic magnesium-protoporphyrin IX monomethyl ester cyclase